MNYSLTKLPDGMDRTLNEDASDKILQYHADHNNRPSNAISFLSAVDCTTGHLHCEFVYLLFLQTHRETDRFFAASGVQLVCV